MGRIKPKKTEGNQLKALQKTQMRKTQRDSLNANWGSVIHDLHAYMHRKP